MKRKIDRKAMLKSSSALLLMVGLLGGIPQQIMAQETGVAFTSTDAEEEGYWYSRYNLGNLSMRSGLGKIATLDQQVIMGVLGAVDADFNPAEFMAKNADYGDGDHVFMYQNVAPLTAVYKSGDPHYITKFNPPDFGTQRWDPAKMDTTLTGAANGWAILKETEWARQFHVDEHFGTIDADFGAQWRFVGMLMNMNAKMQAVSFLQNMSDYDLSDGGDAVMLIALSDLGDILSVSQVAHSDVPNRYLDPEAAAKIVQGADMMFAKVVASQPTSIRTLSLAIQSMVWYGAKTDNVENKAVAMHKITSLVGDLEALAPTDAAEQAYMLRGLVEANRTLGLNNGLIKSLGGAFVDGFDFDKGGFDNQDLYTIDDVGVIVGALNALRIFETKDVDQDAVNEVFTSFWENVVNIGGLQMSAPPLTAVKSPFEYEGEPMTFFRYNDSQPVPPMAGGEFGVAPVLPPRSAMPMAHGQWLMPTLMRRVPCTLPMK